MEARKLISFGKSTHVVSLPREWVKRHQLKKGSVLAIENLHDSLIVSVNARKEDESDKKTITIDADKYSIQEIKSKIVTAYLLNYDVIEITSIKIREKDEKIKGAIQNLAGLEILEQTATRIIAKYLIDAKTIELDSLIRRMDNIARSLIIDAVACLSGEKNYASIKQRDNDVNRLNFLVMRTIKDWIDKCISNDPWKLYQFYLIADKLEKISDRQKRIARCLEQTKVNQNILDEIKKIYGKIHQSYLDAMTAYYKKDKELALSIEVLGWEKTNECKEFLNRYLLDKRFHNPMSISCVVEIIENLKSMMISIKNISRIVLNS